MEKWTLGIDMGGTHTRVGLVDSAMRLAGSCRVYLSSTFTSAAEPVAALWNMLSGFLDAQGVGRGAVGRISIGVPASVRGDLRTIYCAPNLRGKDGRLLFEDYDFAGALERLSGIPTLVNKDVNNLLCYDIRVNGLTGIVAACYIGTGVGGAVSVDGKLLLGRSGVAMDIGHLPLFHGEKTCGCGKRGCAETEIAGTRYLRLCAERFPGEDPATVFVRHGEDAAVRAYVRDCAHVPAILATVFDPSALVLGGGVLELEGFPRRLLEMEILCGMANAVSANPPRFVYADRLPERGVIGAALFAAKPDVIR